MVFKFHAWLADQGADIVLDRFPSPWTVEEQIACFVVRDHNGQALAYIYYEEEAARDAATAKLLKKDEARRIAANIAKIPRLLQR